MFDVHLKMFIKKSPKYVLPISLFCFRMKEDEEKVKDRIKCMGGKFEGDFVCCKEQNSTLTTEPNSTPIPEENSTLIIKNPDPNPPIDKKKITCGRQKPNINVRIFGTDESELVPVSGEFPWIAAIFKRTDDGQYVFDSSGSLVHPKVILTANHYVHR